MAWIWILFGVLVGWAGLNYRQRLRRGLRSESALPRVDEAALRKIEREGQLFGPDEDALDLDEIAREEERFWQDSWDEPEEYRD